MDRIRAVFFDMVGVIVCIYESKIGEALKPHSPLSSEEITKKFFSYHKKEPATLSDKRTSEIYTNAVSELQLKGINETEFLRIMTDIFEPNREVEEIVKELKNYHLVLLTNTCQPHYTQVKKISGVLNMFDTKIISCEVGQLKPSPEIFQTAAKKTGIPFSESVFIDDTEENIIAAERLGLHGIVFENAEQLRRALTALGILHK
jgi:HAD superfamily hydrolase (TIGR01509 family)